MKKISFILMLLAAATASAQSISHPRDTIYGREITYLYGIWYDDTLTCTKNINSTDTWKFSTYYNVDSAKIAGIAIALRRHPYDHYMVVADTDLTHWSETLSLLKPLSDGSMQVLAEGDFNILDTARAIHATHGRCFFDPMNPYPDQFFPIYEVFFDKPIQVTDSFYISYSNDNAYRQKDGYPNYPGYVAHWSMYPQCNDTTTIRVAAMRWGDSVWIKSDYPQIPFMWPILDTTGMNYIAPCDTFVCATIPDLHVEYPNRVRGGMINFAWTGNPGHSRWQISFGPAGTQPGEGTVRDCRTPSADIFGLQDSVHYVCYVRGYCDQCSTWGDWSEGFEYWKEMYSSSSDIRTSVVDQHVAVMPNPASSYVAVTSSFRIISIEAYDLQGSLVADQPVDALSAAIDISSWPAGTYILSIRTNRGTVARKIMKNE